MKERSYLENLKKGFGEKKEELRKLKQGLRGKIDKVKTTLETEERKKSDQKTILEENKDKYLDNISKIQELDDLKLKIDKAKVWFDKLFNNLSEEESLRRTRKETVAFINRIYEKVYKWDINAKLEEDKLVITDAFGNLRSHSSGSEIHVMGLAWRWMIARAFDLPLVLDELDVLLDKENFEKTKKLIEESMDRQTIILTLKEGLKAFRDIFIR